MTDGWMAQLQPLRERASAAWRARSARDRAALLVVGTWSGDQIERFRARLRPAGWSVQSAEGRLVLSRTGSARSST